MSPRSKELSEEMRTKSRAALIAAARKLFAERGYFNCKVSDIAKKAGMSQGNVYWYFSSKEDLLKAVLADGFEMLGEIWTAAAQQPGDSLEKFHDMFNDLYMFVREKGEFNTIMLSLLGHGGEAFFRELGFDMPKIGLGYTRSVAALIAQAQSEGVLEEDADPVGLTMLFFAFFNGLNLTYAQEWLELPQDFIRDAALRLIGAHHNLQGDKETVGE